MPPALAIVGLAVAIDGDTIEISGQRIRLHGIDAPETAQWCGVGGHTWPCGRSATAHLSEIIAGRPVSCAPRGVHRERVVATCTVQGRDVARLMVERGMALDWPQYSGGAYKEAEFAARMAGAGLWKGDFVPPWIWRKNRSTAP